MVLILSEGRAEEDIWVYREKAKRIMIKMFEVGILLQYLFFYFVFSKFLIMKILRKKLTFGVSFIEAKHTHRKVAQILVQLDEFW